MLNDRTDDDVGDPRLRVCDWARRRVMGAIDAAEKVAGASAPKGRAAAIRVIWGGAGLAT